ncbi:MAG TPA: hypothetical protein VGC99_16270 [Candidatus Tectomicrobia bacterium]
MGLLASFIQKLRRKARAGDLSGADEGNWREAFAVAFRGLVLEQSAISYLLEKIPPETQKELRAGFDQIEARIFDLWLVSHALRRSVKHVAKADLFAVLDLGHLEVYRNLVASGMTEQQVMDLQDRLPPRYSEYDNAYAGFWIEDADRGKWMFQFARLVTAHVFGQETTDIRVALMLATIVNNKVIAIGQTFGEFRPS